MRVATWGSQIVQLKVCEELLKEEERWLKVGGEVAQW
jgi:hypothetical protein